MIDWRITICINSVIYNLSDCGYNRILCDYIVLKRIGSCVFEGEYVHIINRKVFDDYLHEFKRRNNYHFADYKNKRLNNNKS